MVGQRRSFYTVRYKLDGEDMHAVMWSTSRWAAKEDLTTKCKRDYPDAMVSIDYILKRRY